MTGYDVAVAFTYVAQALAMAAVAYAVGRFLIAAVDSEVKRSRTRRADGATDIEPRAFADAVRSLLGGAR